MKKEIGIEKLINLLNEFETPQSGVVFKSYDDYDGTFYGVDCDGETEIAWSDSYICGKRFGWVEWLVENDKIDYLQLIEDNTRNILKENGGDNKTALLMLLSISSSPIDDLISYLK